MPKIKLHLSIGYANASRSDVEEIDDAEWAEMTEKERQDYLDELAAEWANNYIDLSARVVE